MTGEEAIRRGYRRVSNRHRIVSRVDREDWIEALAKFLLRRPEQLKGGDWPGFYRRVLSADHITLSATEFRKVPPSDFDPVGFVPPAAGEGEAQPPK